MSRTPKVTQQDHCSAPGFLHGLINAFSEVEEVEVHALESITRALNPRSFVMSGIFLNAMQDLKVFDNYGMPDVSDYTPADFRRAIAEQVKEGNTLLAEALGDAGQILYPDSEDVLSIVALLAEMRQDWDSAECLLRQLVEVQDELSPPATWQHLIRVLRCNGKPLEAWIVLIKSLKIHPADEVLLSEEKSLQDWLGGSTLVEGTETRS